MIKEKTHRIHINPQNSTTSYWTALDSDPFPSVFAILTPEVAPKWCCGSSSPADPEIGASAPGGGGVGAPAPTQPPKSGRVKRMVRLAAELLLLLGLLLLTLHITVLRSNPLPQGNGTAGLDGDAALTGVSQGNLIRRVPGPGLDQIL